MKITFLGATHEVTGSCTLLESQGKNFLVDVGMEQGPDIFVNQRLPMRPEEVDTVFLTHAHIDHSGNLPLLGKKGFQGKIYATEETVNLCRIMLMDSAGIQEFEAEWRNRKAKRSGNPPYEPLYTREDAAAVLEKMQAVPYGQLWQVTENTFIRFNDMGHLLGSASIEVWLTEDGLTKKIVFSGDVGNKNRPILNEPVKITEADYLVVESTYGDRLHEQQADTLPILTDCIQRTLDRGGNVVIPAFAVGRTQEMLYYLRKIKDGKLIRGHEGFPVYLDSPLANEATAVFLQSRAESFDEEIQEMFRQGINPLIFPDLKISASTEESKAINFDPAPKVIISASGMCEAGRVRHHLKHNLWRPESMVLFAGYQAKGTLGRLLLDGLKEVKLFGETIRVAAELFMVPGISGHADRDGLLDWIRGFEKMPELIFVNHGEDEVADNFAALVTETFGVQAVAPHSGTSYNLKDGSLDTLTEGIPIEKSPPLTKRDTRALKVFGRLVAACERLLGLAQKSEGLPNKELAKFADQVEQLARKWED